ncbi:nitrogenase iron-molybdenum cofactor biosynthesis protein NifE [Desulfurispirillum indicum]|uniref:Nitrogenase MoFe cofactor biosynthesis protein NifE n=1 Tax=Desulfurispirillum indicum (strain ATCC BAA-1389 / DSM 22839 / S5) TaxID=653733 RepID=E6W6L8_DESIS|nr:nitrogenase iron-molybdenum cofactor biosynthesis protein NifE [Desulfurispirillum indicum]ADU65018.1 nitrogenase MoFe cofactor biosynthesis protein NifE [Desulfurispirillum indicum S5]UCZ56921.1 nitrogenase iron-molybdenum cofactor biosynthesis protein NifE [Desulfurispirillum indicum]
MHRTTLPPPDTTCEHHQGGQHQQQKKPKCAKPTPGGALGGCAFDGAQIVLLPIADAAHLIHSPATCVGNSWNNRGTRSSHSAMYRQGFTTDLTEMDIIMGAEQKLLQAALELAQRFAPPAIFIYSTCVSAMTGEDIGAVAAEVGRQTGIPVIPVDSPGFVGSKNYGNKIAGQVLLEHVIGTATPPHTTDTDVAIIADYNIAGELWRIEPLLERAGIRLLSRITGDATYAEVAWAHYARANMVVCSRALVDMARQLEAKHGIPYFEGSFYGMQATSDALRTMARMLKVPEIQQQVEAVIASEEARTRAALAPYLPFLKDKKVFVYSGGVKSWSMVFQLEELGMEVVGSGIRKSSEEDIERLRIHFEGTQKIMLEKGDGAMMLELLEREGADVFIAGSRNMFTAMKGRYPYVDVNQERIFSYAGYDGLVELARQLYHTMTSPVFDVARTTAPWESP